MGKALERAALVLPRGYLHGLTLSTAGASATFSVALGEAVDDTFASLMTTAALSKTTSAWAVGTATGSLDTGAIAINTWYHVYLIKRTDTGVVDVLISLSATAPTMPTSYTLKRRIGSMKTNASSQWLLFIQFGDEFAWDAGITEGSSIATTATAITQTLIGVPSGVRVIANLSGSVTGNGTQTFYAFPGDLTGNTGLVFGQVSSANSFNGFDFRMLTNTSAQIKISSSAAGFVNYLDSKGWTDFRGRQS